LALVFLDFFIIHSDPKKTKQVISKLMKVKNTWLIATVIGSLEGISLEFFVYTIEEYSKL